MGFPFDEQLPNVGRVDEDYTFTMANSTYKSSSNGEITYQVSNLPSWLSFDSGSRTLTGKPSESDVGEFDITIKGTDQSDQSTLSNNYTMIVSNDTGLHVNSDTSVFQQLAQYGNTNGDDGLVVKPGDKISLKFSKDTFESYSSSQRSIVAYYGRSADRSSLPNWISFDGEELTFSGTVPHVTSENAPSFEYGFSFIASDYYGYAGASSVFKIIVGGHQLETDLNSTVKINGTFGQDVDEVVPITSHVYLDGQLISKDNISEVDADDLPSYLSFNDADYTITGNFPNTSTFDNFSITVSDTYGNTVDLPYSFNAIGSIFTINSLDDVNATKGEWFQYQIMNSIFTNANETEVNVNFDKSNWLSYHDSNKTLNGITPKSFDSLKVTIEGKLDSEDEEKSFSIKGVNEHITSSSSSSTSTSTSMSSGTAGAATASATDDSSNSNSASGASHNSNKNRDLAIGLGVGIPVFVILVAAFIIFCCCYKRRNSKQESDDEKGTVTSATTQVPGSTSSGGKAAAAAGAGAATGAMSTFPMDPKNESQVNLMKLEGVSANSSSSSLTHVDTNESFYDTQEQPVSKSWRANLVSDDKAVITPANLTRNSDASLSTVNTEQLFSVRLVEDHSQRDSEISSAKNAFMSNNSLNALLQRDNSSQNIQRLDSDGNIVEYDTLAPTSSPERMPNRLPHSTSQLDIVPEENSRDMSNREDTTGSIGNLLHKFDRSSSGSSSEDNNDNSSPSPSPSPSPQPPFTMGQSQSPTFLFEFNKPELKSPQSDNFLLNDPQQMTNNQNTANNSYLSPTSSPTRQRHLLSTQTQNNNQNPHQSILTLDSISSEKFIYDGRLRPVDSLSPVKNLCTRTSSGSLLSGGNATATGNDRENGGATLVDFTRKASLRDSSYEPDHTHREESATLHHDDSD
ncbi:AXL2 [Candida margitis]|uniref:AXL2 n=1 Tax=Candida margitis TaxID=1775924 RepID=UPI0022265B08|nr:AXL2 [Candida margitis]KAI5970508.1 AXL2 [Candida margitis]